LRSWEKGPGKSRRRQSIGESIVHEIGVERKGALEFCQGGVMLALEKQNKSKRSASLRQAGVEARRHLCQFNDAIERRGRASSLSSGSI
jgi:hypothetical protein